MPIRSFVKSKLLSCCVKVSLTQKRVSVLSLGLCYFYKHISTCTATISTLWNSFFRAIISTTCYSFSKDIIFSAALAQASTPRGTASARPSALCGETFARASTPRRAASARTLSSAPRGAASARRYFLLTNCSKNMETKANYSKGYVVNIGTTRSGKFTFFTDSGIFFGNFDLPLR